MPTLDWSNAYESSPVDNRAEPSTDIVIPPPGLYWAFLRERHDGIWSAGDWYVIDASDAGFEMIGTDTMHRWDSPHWRSVSALIPIVKPPRP